MKSNLVAIAGFKGSGKDTIGDYLCRAYGFEKDSFASPLKDACAAIFGWDREMVEGSTPEARAAREVVDQWWADRLGIPDWSPRRALQYIGTEILRDKFHKTIWLDSFEKRFLLNPDRRVVITDCRFGNELDLVERLGGTTIAVMRGEKPNWWDIAKQANQGSSDAVVLLREMDIHASEYSWVGRNVNHTIINDGSLEDLFSSVDKALS